MNISSELRKNISHRLQVIIISIVALALALLLIATKSWSESNVIEQLGGAKKLELIVGKSIVLKSSNRIKRVSIAAPEVADFVLLSPFEVYLTGKGAGLTNLTLWHQNFTSVYDIEVIYDISRLKQKLHEILPDEKDLRVISTNDTITLSGTISSTENLSQVLAITRAFAPKDKILNLTQVAGVQQVMLEVRVAEMARTTQKSLGINFSYINGNDFVVSLIGGLANAVTASPTLFPGQAVTALFSVQKNGNTLTGFIDALNEEGLLKILAEPTLVCLSGQSANFLAGGEFPVPVPQDQDTITIEYKQFGVFLDFTPTVLSENRINIVVRPEVSELDFTTAVQFEGFVTPGVTTRQTSTVVQLADGQSFAIAGLLREVVRDRIAKYPILGDIPILGALFRSRSFLKNETELIIIVTAHLVKPLDLAKQTLPTDFYIEPNDMELYLLGWLQGKEKEKPVGPKGEFDGEFGPAMPISN